METITEDYVSFETARLLKEKGFEQHKCQHSYDSKGMFKWSDDLDPYEYSAPTLQIAMKWLREVHSLSVEIFSIKGTSNICPVFWKGNVVKLLTQDRAFSGELVSSYEKAVEATLKYSLENLI